MIEKLITHKKRYHILGEKLSKHLESVEMLGDKYVKEEDYITHIIILNDVIETMSDMLNDVQDINKEIIRGSNLYGTALKTYAEIYGNELIVDEGHIEFDKQSNLTVSIIPNVGETTITVEIKDEE